MDSYYYELLAQIMKYWFAALIVYIVIRSAGAVRRSFSFEKRIEKQRKGGYAFGVIEVIDPGRSRQLLGERFALRQENRLGSSSSCDIRIRERSVEGLQAIIYLKQREKKIYISDYGTRGGVGLNGYKVNGDIPLMDGDEIQLSGVVLRLHLKIAFSSAIQRDIPAPSREFDSQHQRKYSDDMIDEYYDDLNDEDDYEDHDDYEDENHGEIDTEYEEYDEDDYEGYDEYDPRYTV